MYSTPYLEVPGKTPLDEYIRIYCGDGKKPEIKRLTYVLHKFMKQEYHNKWGDKDHHIHGEALSIEFLLKVILKLSGLSHKEIDDMTLEEKFAYLYLFGGDE